MGAVRWPSPGWRVPTAIRVVARRRPDRLRQQPERDGRWHDRSGAVREERRWLRPVRRLTDTPNNAASIAPAWSPAGNQIAYESNADGSFEIYTSTRPPRRVSARGAAPNELGPELPEPELVPGRDTHRVRARHRDERGGHHEGDLDDEGGRDRSCPAHERTASTTCSRPTRRTAPGSRTRATRAVEREIYTRPATAGGTSMNVTSTSAGAADEQPDWGWGGPPTPRGPLRLADLDDPTLGVDVNVEPVSGTVLVGIRGAARAAGLGTRQPEGHHVRPARPRRARSRWARSSTRARGRFASRARATERALARGVRSSTPSSRSGSRASHAPRV